MTPFKAKNPFDAAEYARLTGFEGKWRDTWWNRDFLEIIARRCGLQEVETLLDVGCGAGHWARALSRVLPPGAHIAGVDIEQAFLDQAEEAGAAFGLSSMDYRLAEAEKLPFADAAFDLVTCQTLLIQVQDPALVLAEMMRVLKPGGALLLAEPNNLGGYFTTLLSEPRPDWPDILRLLDCYHTCVEGKKRLGFGDSALGEALPGLVTAAGFQDVAVVVNENCPSLFPPYASEQQQMRFGLEGHGGARMGFGPRDNVLKFYLAGGGEEAAFDAVWDLAVATQTRVAEALQLGTYSGSRGFPMYLVMAKKGTETS